MLNKYFSGYQSGISIDLLIEAIEYHYEGLDSDSKAVLKGGLTDLLSECGQCIHRDEIFKNMPLDLNEQGFLVSTQKSAKNLAGVDASSRRIVTVQETLNGVSLAESDNQSNTAAGGGGATAAGAAGDHIALTQNITARTGSQYDAEQ